MELSVFFLFYFTIMYKAQEPIEVGDYRIQVHGDMWVQITVNPNVMIVGKHPLGSSTK